MVDKSDENQLNIPFLEEIKVDLPPTYVRSANSVTESHAIHEYIRGFIAEEGEMQDGYAPPQRPEEVVTQKARYLTKELVSMGFEESMVLALLRNFEISDVSAAIDLLVKSPMGWTHAFTSRLETGNCEICKEPLSEHVENIINNPRKQSDKSQRSSRHSSSVKSYHVDHEIIQRILNNDPEFVKQPLRDSIKLPEPLLQPPIPPQEENGPEISCPVCMENFTQKHDLFALSCKHYHCLNCTKEYLKTIIMSGAVLEIKCPFAGCEQKFTSEIIKTLVTPELYEKYANFKENIEVNISNNRKWCSAPGCGKAVKGSASHPHVVCECGFHMCFKCGEAWHGSTSCAKNFEKLYSNWASSKNIQKCPKCKIRIEKDEGCNHMTCAFCRYEWCWICGGKYNYHHFDSYFFGCGSLQFTDGDWSMAKIFFFQLAMIILWPIICLAFSAMTAFKFTYEKLNLCGCPCLLFSWIILLVSLLGIYIVMLIPSYFYKLWRFLCLFPRLCRN